MNLNAPARLGVFGAALAASLGVGLAVGAAVGPVDTGDAPAPHEIEHDATTAPPSTAVDHSQVGHTTHTATP